MKKTLFLITLCCLCSISQAQNVAATTFGPTGGGLSLPSAAQFSSALLTTAGLLVLSGVCVWALFVRCVLADCSKLR